MIDDRIRTRERVLAGQIVEMSDGVGLYTDVYLPEAEAAAPAIVMRTPYGRTTPLLMQMALHMANRGLAVVMQDSRGRYKSKGAYSLPTEARDCRETLCWINRQPWCTGSVGLVGLSVSSLPNLMAAVDPAPEQARVGAVADVMGAVDYRQMCYRGGALLYHWILPWMAMMQPGGGENGQDGRDWLELFRHRPLVDAASLAGANDWIWRQVVTTPGPGEFWRGLSILDRLPEIGAPALLLSGWSDFMLGQTLTSFRRMADNRDAYLVVGPWNHRSLFASTGREAVGDDVLAADGSFDLKRVLTDWFTHWLGGDGGPGRGPWRRTRASLYLENADRWIESDTFPPPECETEEWFLASSLGAEGDGELSRSEPESPTTAAFDYDPSNPAPTVGGAVWPFPPAGLVAGHLAQPAACERSDVRLYASAPLAEEVDVVGDVELELWASSSAKDTDFTAKLVDLDRRGRAMWVQDGIIRARYRNGVEEPEFLEPNRPYRFTIALGGLAYRFRRGHRIGVEVSSSNYPKFDAHLNTAQPLHTATWGTVARQTVFHGGERASRLRLPRLRATDPGKGAEA